MEEKDKSNATLPVSVMFILFTAIGLVIYTPSPFKGSRPDIKQTAETSGKVSARLWQDPFGAVLGAPLDELKECKKSSGCAELKNEVDNRSKRSENKKIVVLGVMVFGAPYTEETEMRIRQRYAVLSGLAQYNFIPDDPEHIQYIRYNPDPKKQKAIAAGKISIDDIVPYEWLKRTEGNESVLLLWLNDNSFRSSPTPIGSLWGAFSNFGINDENADIRIIGPAGSTTLAEMIREANTKKPTGTMSKPKLKIFSATATVEDAQLLKDAGIGGDAKTLDEFFRNNNNNNIEFLRAIGGDPDLADKLVEELRLRRCINKKITIALVSEWDTYYGRHLPDTFKAAIKNAAQNENKDMPEILSFTYMRGIDGKLPGEESQNKQDDKKDHRKQDGSPSSQEMEQATGKSQFDYLRRLSDKIYLLDRERKNDKKKGIKAIGILGSDFYDKFLVLQALRQRMPWAVFFTTDLDARYLQTDYKKWTRNLIVASHFGLELKSQDKKDQGNIPPFRDTYQTSVFNATLKALEKPQGSRLSVPARIFEIGSRTAVPLDDARKPIPRIIMLSFCIIVGLVLLYLSSFRIRELLEHRKIIIIAALVAVSFIAVLFIKSVMNNIYEEPFSLFEGISIWPTEILRLISAILSVSFIIYAFSRLSRNIADIKKDYFAGEIMPHPCGYCTASGQQGNVFRCIRDLIRRQDVFTVRRVEQEEYEKSGDITQVLTKYSEMGCSESRLVRSLMIFLVYLLFSILFIRYFGLPDTPVRGTISIIINKVVIFISLICFLSLTFIVVDTTRLCTFFIDTIAKRTPVWPEKSYNLFLSEHIREPGLFGEWMTPISVSAKNVFGEWMIVNLVARRTDVVSKLIFYPVVVWLVLFISRSSYFDDWKTPVHLAFLISLPAVYAWSSAFILRRSAERMRNRVIERLERRHDSAIFGMSPDQDIAKQIEYVLAEVKSIKTGAFSPFSRHPIVRSLLTILGGVGGVTALEFIQLLNI